MRLGIDASNITGGGGLTHLVELLQAAEPVRYGFNQVVLWGSANILRQVDERAWLLKMHDPLLDQMLPVRLYWQRYMLDRLVLRTRCDLLFVPGGNYQGHFRPFVTMSRNLLPFEPAEARRYGVSWLYLKLQILRQAQSKAMRQADGVIFLTNYARDVVMRVLEELRGRATVIPHGVNKSFECPPRLQNDIDFYSDQNPFRILYVSIVTVYKHQWHVAEAVAALRRQGLPVCLELVGLAYRPALNRLLGTLKRLDPDEEFIHYRGPVTYAELNKEYQRADVFVFASTCETFGQIVTEAMAAGLPIACSDTGTNRELLAENALYFDPEQPKEIAKALRKMIEDPTLRVQLAWGAYKQVQSFSWERCAQETFDFLSRVAQEFAD